MGNFADADAHPGTFRAVAWSEAYDVPPVARPSVVQPHPNRDAPERDSARNCASEGHADYRSGVVVSLVGIAACVILLLAACAVVAFGTGRVDPGPRTVYVAPTPVTLKAPHNP